MAADVELDSVPSNPADGEQVTAVHVLPGADAIDFLAQFDDGPGLDIVRLAKALGLTPA